MFLQPACTILFLVSLFLIADDTLTTQTHRLVSPFVTSENGSLRDLQVEVSELLTQDAWRVRMRLLSQFKWWHSLVGEGEREGRLILFYFTLNIRNWMPVSHLFTNDSISTVSFSRDNSKQLPLECSYYIKVALFVLCILELGNLLLEKKYLKSQ